MGRLRGGGGQRGRIATKGAKRGEKGEANSKRNPLRARKRYQAKSAAVSPRQGLRNVIRRRAPQFQRGEGSLSQQREPPKCAAGNSCLTKDSAHITVIKGSGGGGGLVFFIGF